ncbi:MAG: DUF5659 domain-containing protein [bacterium]
MEMKGRTYQTKSIELASFLLSKGYSLIKTELNGNGRVIFVFTVKSGIETDIQEFNSGTALVKVKDIFSSISRIKGLIWDHRRK